jgi:alpha/beta superfamily hydrolase
MTIKQQEFPAFQLSEHRVSEEQVVFRSRQNANLYGVLYRNANSEQKGAVTICPPDVDERTWSQRVLVNFSRMLAVNGYTVLRFDYEGQGESQGEYEDSTISTRRDDVESAVSFLLDRTEMNTISIVGVRLGGTVAALAASNNAAVTSLVLWEPIIDLHAYLYGLLRVNISAQMVMHKAVLKDREKLVEEILAGGAVGINGFYLTKRFFQEAMDVSVEDALKVYHGKCLVALSPASKWPFDGVGEVIRPKFSAFWKEPRIYAVRPQALMDGTIQWIGETTNTVGSR